MGAQVGLLLLLLLFLLILLLFLLLLLLLPRGTQASWAGEVGPTEPDILVNKLRPGHEMEMVLYAVKVAKYFVPTISNSSIAGNWTRPRQVLPRVHGFLQAASLHYIAEVDKFLGLMLFLRLFLCLLLLLLFSYAPFLPGQFEEILH